MLYRSPILSRYKNIVHGWHGVPPNVPRHFQSVEEADSQHPLNMSHALTALNMENSRPVLLRQNHGKTVYTVTPDFFQSYVQEKIPEGDGLVTQHPSISLGVRTADCGPILWAEPEAGIIAACHAGWRGAVGGILQETHKAICKLGGHPNNIVAILGPTISGSSYSVDDDFRETCRREAPDSELFFRNDEGQFYFDLPQFIVHKIRQIGIKSVDILPYDTFSGPFYSRRASLQNGCVYGSNYAFIMLSS